MGGRGGSRGLLGGRGAVWQRGSGLGVPQLGPGCRGGRAEKKLLRLTTSLAPVHFPLAVLLLFVVCFLPHKKGGDQHGAAPAAGISA